MTIFLTGGTGKTGSKLAPLLHAAGESVLIASRSGKAPEPFKAVKFDWLDQSTFENPFKVDSNIDRVYLIGPAVINALEVVKPFIDLAISKGVKRFVLLSASAVEKGDAPNGKIHEYLVNLGVDYVVLRPTWFIENFGALLIHSIRASNEISTAAGDGKIPFIGVDDIAKAAFDALVAKKSPNTDYYLVGPKAYSYDEAVAILSEVVGRKITHKRLTNEQETAIFTAWLPADYAKFLNGLTQAIPKGQEERLLTSDKAIIGKEDLRKYFEANKQLWIV